MDTREADENELLHRGGPASGWRNLGCWSAGDEPALAYAQAGAALADRIAQAATLGPEDHVLSLGCGAGEELLRWVQQHGVAAVVGIEQDPRLAHAAHRRAAAAALAPQRITVLAQSGLPRHSSFAPERFDAVVCVDAAYHFSPRADWLLAAHASLRPGGRLAYTDLTITAGSARGWLLRRAARMCGLDGSDLATHEAQSQRLLDLGFDAVRAERLDDEVLGGFARFVARQRRLLGTDARLRGWQQVARTAALIGPARALGLGYALFVARKPLAGPA